MHVIKLHFRGSNLDVRYICFWFAAFVCVFCWSIIHGRASQRSYQWPYMCCIVVRWMWLLAFLLQSMHCVDVNICWWTSYYHLSMNIGYKKRPQPQSERFKTKSRNNCHNALLSCNTVLWAIAKRIRQMLNGKTLSAFRLKPNTQKRYVFHWLAEQRNGEQMSNAIFTEAERSRVAITKLAVNCSIAHNPEW